MHVDDSQVETGGKPAYQYQPGAGEKRGKWVPRDDQSAQDVRSMAYEVAKDIVGFATRFVSAGQRTSHYLQQMAQAEGVQKLMKNITDIPRNPPGGERDPVSPNEY